MSDCTRRSTPVGLAGVAGAEKFSERIAHRQAVVGIGRRRDAGDVEVDLRVQRFLLDVGQDFGDPRDTLTISGVAYSILEGVWCPKGERNFLFAEW